MKNIFALRLSQAMDLRNITQAELVEKTGITKGAISQYLKGEYIPKRLNTNKIARALNINPTWLTGESDTIEKYYGIQEGGGRYPKETVLLLRSFNKLNELGKNEAIKRVEELSYIDKYTEKDHKNINEQSDYYILNAAHEIKGAVIEDIQHDEEIMKDDNF